jgi:DNA polymerase-3 subunit delta
MLSSKFDKELKRGLPSPVYFLISKESILLEQALNEIKAVFFTEGQEDFNYNLFYGSSNPQEIIDSAMTFPFLSARRLVVIKDFHEFEDSSVKTLKKYISNPQETTCMVILSIKPVKEIERIMKDVYNFQVRERDIPSWVKELANKKGILFTKDAVDCLIDSVGTDLGLLSMEVEKLAMSGLKSVTSSDIIATVGMTREYVPFNLIDALVSGDRLRAFTILRTIIEARPNDAPSIIGAINWHYSRIYDIWMKEGRRPLKIKESTYRHILKHLSSYNYSHFQRIFQYLHEADVDVKSSLHNEYVLEVLLLKLLQIGAES